MNTNYEDQGGDTKITLEKVAASYRSNYQTKVGHFSLMSFDVDL